jgi:hypothetical protein
MGASDLLHLAAGALLVLLAWLVPRHIARSRRAHLAVLLLDVAPIALGAGLLVLAAGRPLFAGVVVAALGAGFALADYTMRQTLREPAVFSEAVELPQLFTHPHLYLPFAGPGLVLGGAAMASLLAVGLLIVEPPLWQPRPLAALAAVALIAAGLSLAAREPLLGVAAGALRRHARPSGEPFEDAAALGPFAMLFVHTVVARSERGPRQRALGLQHLPDDVPPQPCHSAAIAKRMTGTRSGPIILVQCESFFDARRLSTLIPRELLAGFERCCTKASRFGRLEVPGWGANTMRAEFAVLTGIPESDLGYDRFNPYYALTRVPIASHVWRLRRAGYRTLCLHPFDRRFFRRDRVMPALGFERFLGREALGGSRTPPYYADPLLAHDILRVLDAEGPDTFIFAITMGNHGPWLAEGPRLDPAVSRLFDPSEIPDGGGLLRYLDGLKRSDEMLQILMAGLERRGSPAVLAFYGDHLPSLSRAFAHFGFAEGSSDYVIWHSDAARQGSAPQRCDIAAHRLGGLVIDGAPDGADPPPVPDRGACLAPPEPARFAQ